MSDQCEHNIAGYCPACEYLQRKLKKQKSPKALRAQHKRKRR